MFRDSVSDQCAVVQCQCSSQQPVLPCRNFLLVTRCHPPFGIVLFLYTSTPSLTSLSPAIRLSHLALLSFRRDTSMMDRQRVRGIASETFKRTHDAVESPLYPFLINSLSLSLSLSLSGLRGPTWHSQASEACEHMCPGMHTNEIFFVIFRVDPGYVFHRFGTVPSL